MEFICMVNLCIIYDDVTRDNARQISVHVEQTWDLTEFKRPNKGLITT